MVLLYRERIRILKFSVKSIEKKEDFRLVEVTQEGFSQESSLIGIRGKY